MYVLQCNTFCVYKRPVVYVHPVFEKRALATYFIDCIFATTAISSVAASVKRVIPETQKQSFHFCQKVVDYAVEMFVSKLVLWKRTLNPSATYNGQA